MNKSKFTNTLRSLTFATALVFLPTIASATITFSEGYSGPWEWNELTMSSQSEGSGMNISTFYKGTAEITGYSGSATEITIPSKISWHHDVTGPDVATHFEYEVEIVGIGILAFFGCRGLTSVTIGNGVTNIGNSAFYSCSGLSSVAIPDSVTSIGNSAFYSCSGLSSVAIPDSVTSIGDSAFYSCSGLSSVAIPDSVTSIGAWAFYGCSGLTSVTIGNGVTSICGSAFGSCDGLQNVYLSSIAAWCAVSIAEVNTSTASPFYYASSLYLNGRLVTDLVIPDGVDTIFPYAFYNCDSLRSVHIPDSVTNIGFQAFSKCDNITEVRVPQCAMTQGLANVFPNSYQKLRRLRLGTNVTSIRDDEFHDFNTLEEVMVVDGNEAYCIATGGCLYNADMTTLVVCPRNATQVVIPNSVTRVYNHALYGCGALWANWYKALSNLAANGGGSSGASGSSEASDPRYTLADGVADRSIATVTVDGDCAIDAFVLADGKVFDTVLRVINVADSAATLSLPAGYAYERLKGTSPLTIPASSTNLLTITRTADRVFFVAREQLESAQ